MGGLVSSVGDLFGGASNNAGTTAQGAPIIQPVTQNQTNTAQSTAAQYLGNAGALANSLTPQALQGAQTQTALTQALQNEANGVGANPAQAALAQNTGQNVANQAALAAGQRGASGNVGLIQRQAGQLGAGVQQAAVGQAATLGAQQQLAAQQQLQTLAGNQIGQSQTATNAANSIAQQDQSTLLNSLQGYNTNQVQSIGSQNSANAGIAQTNANQSAAALGLLGSGVGSLLGSNVLGGGSSSLGSTLPAAASPSLGVNTSSLPAAGSAGAPTSYGFLAEGGMVGKDEAHISAQSMLAQALSNKKMPEHMKAMAQIYHPHLINKMCSGGVAMAKGAEVPGEPQYPGKNTVKQDKVPALLTPKEIVLPLTVTQAKNPGEAAKAFVEHIKGKDSDHDEFKKGLKEHIKGRKFK